MRGRIVVLSLVIAAGAVTVAAAADRDVSVDVDHRTVEFDGAKASGSNLIYFGPAMGPCSKLSPAYCDETLIHVTVPPDAEHSTLRIDNIGNGTDDFDAYLYESDESGGPGLLVDFSNNEGSVPESVSAAEPSLEYYLLKVVYFAVDDASYHARAQLLLPDRFSATPTPTPTETATPTPTPTPETSPTPDASPTPQGSPTPGPQAQQSAATAAPPSVAGRTEPLAATGLPSVRLVRRTSRSAVVAVACPTGCRAGLRAGNHRRSFRVDAQDTREMSIRTARARRVSVRVTPSGGGAVIARSYLTRTRAPGAPRKTTR